MQLQQIHLAYHINEDRLLLRVSLRDSNGELQEIRAWITRNLLKSLWSGIIGALETQVAIEQPHAAYARTAIMEMQHEASLAALQSQGSFNQQFQTGINKFPLGDQPILLTQVHITVAPDQGTRIKFVSARNGNFELSFIGSTLHALCKILQDAMTNVDWGLPLQLTTGNQQSANEHRLLN